jgi:hypothetical protein
MNRVTRLPGDVVSSVPHERGDEPSTNCRLLDSIDVFPTSVGMNRACLGIGECRARVPSARALSAAQGLMVLKQSVAELRATCRLSIATYSA